MRALPLLALLLAPCAAGFDLSPARLGWMREAEKKHGRVALLALPSLAAVSALADAEPVSWLNAQPAAVQLSFYSTAAALESLNLRRLGRGFVLRDDAKPGKVLPVGDVDPNLDAIEDVAGRAAMLLAASTLVESLL